MTFSSPYMLILLSVPLVLLIWYVRRQRAKDDYVLRWTNFDALESTQIRTASLRRHLAAVLFIVSLVTLVIAVAQPAIVSDVKVYNTRVVVAMDSSISMGATDVSPSRYAAAIEAIDRFVQQAGSEVEVGLVTFSGEAAAQIAPTYDRARVVEALRTTELAEGTAIGDAVILGTRMLQSAQGPTSNTGAQRPSPGAIIVISDGASTAGRTDQDAASIAKAANVRVSTVVYGTESGEITYRGDKIDVPIDETALTEISDTTGGSHYIANSGTELDQVFENLSESTSTQQVPLEVTDRFTFAAMVLLCLAGAFALATSPRLP